MISQEIHRALAPTGTLRAGINLSNFLLVSGRNADGTPAGVSPDLARHIARVLDVPCQFVTFDTPGELADAAADDLWDIGNIAHCLLYTSPSPRDKTVSRMPSSA